MAGDYAVTYIRFAKFPSDSSITEANTSFSEFYVYPHLSLCVLFIPNITLAVNNDNDRN